MPLLTCVRCGASKTVLQGMVGGVPTLKWFEGRGKLCATCFDSNVADPRDGRMHRNGSDTEQEAAASVHDVTGKLRAKVLLLLQNHPDGLTDDEGGMYMDGDRLTFGRRRQELVAAGHVVDSGKRRPTPRGRSAIVWTLVP